MAGRNPSRAQARYSAEAKTLLKEVGIETQKFHRAYDAKLYAKRGTAAFFDKETFGEDRLVTGMNTTPWREFLAKAPLSDAVKRDIARIYTEKADHLPGMTRERKNRDAERNQLCGLFDQPLPADSGSPAVFSDITHDLFCVGIEAVPAYACYEAGDDYGSFTYPGFDGLGFRNTKRKSRTFSIFQTGMLRWLGCWCVR